MAARALASFAALPNASSSARYLPATTLPIIRTLSTFHPLLQAKRRQMPPRPKPPPEDEIKESFLKGSGPGGQKINKTNSAVQLKHIPTGIVIKTQATRSRTQNRNIARELLAQKLDELYSGELSRTSIVSAMKKKKADSAAKKARRKYRAIEAEKAEEASLEENAEQKENTANVTTQPVIPPTPEISSLRIDDPPDPNSNDTSKW